jgi:hypothetical protein
VSDRLAGLALFLPVPVVLFLFTQAPLGLAASLGLGVLLMLSHRFYARPWALARATHRCLWCAGAAGPEGPALELEEPFGRTAWRACGEPHAERLRRVFAWAAGHAAFLKAGILGTLAAFLLLAATRVLPHADAAALFRIGIALTVLPVAVLSPRAVPAQGGLRLPFPAHIQALIGTSAVLWLFRIVGVVWLALALRHALLRAGLA